MLLRRIIPTGGFPRRVAVDGFPVRTGGGFWLSDNRYYRTLAQTPPQILVQDGAYKATHCKAPRIASKRARVVRAWGLTPSRKAGGQVYTVVSTFPPPPSQDRYTLSCATYAVVYSWAKSSGIGTSAISKLCQGLPQLLHRYLRSRTAMDSVPINPVIPRGLLSRLPQWGHGSLCLVLGITPPRPTP